MEAIGIDRNSGAESTIEALRVTLEMDALHPSNNYPSIDSGLELAFRERAFLRVGYSGLGMDDSVEGISLGGGVRLEMGGGNALAVDYGFKDFGPFGYLQAISLDISL